MEQLVVCKTEDGRFAVRPISWAGIWGKNGMLANECNSLAYFEEEQDANDYIAYRALGTVEELSALVKAQDEGRVALDEKTALALAAGARAIENNKRLSGTTYGWDIFGECGGPKEISYFEAAKRLREISEPILTRAEAEATQGGGGDG